MNNWLTLLTILVVFFVAQKIFAGPVLKPAEIQARLASGEAILIDVREASEWSQGVASPALLLALSDLQGARKDWRSVLEANKDKELILYCRSGNRSGQATRLLAKEGFRTANGGSFAAWHAAGLPTRQP